MTRLSRILPTPGRGLTALLAIALTACGAQEERAVFSDIALPTFSKERVAAEAPVEARRLLASTEPFAFHIKAPSPDGRYLTGNSWQLGNGGAALIDLTTGEKTYIPNQGRGFVDSKSAFSPDGTRVAFTYWTYEGLEIRSMGVDGSDPQVHLVWNGNAPDAEGFVMVTDWSPDGRLLLVNGYPADGDPHLATIDVATNEYRIVETLGGRGAGVSYFSPDGRFVVYDMRSNADAKERDIYLTSLDGTVHRTLIRTPDHEQLLGWLPDGSGILFHRSAADSRAIWKLPVDDGRPSGQPELVKDDVWTIDGFGFSDSDYFYGVVVSGPQVHTASFDLETGRMLEAPTPVVEMSHEGTFTGVWSPDGQRLAYLEDDAEDVSVTIRSLTGDVLRRLPLSLDVRMGLLAWVPRGLLVRGRDASGRSGLFLLSPETGESSYVTDVPIRGVTVAEGGSTLFIDWGEADASDIVSYDLETGREQVVATAEFLFGEASSVSDWTNRPEWNWTSPNGKYVAHGLSESGDRLFRVIDTETGERRRTQERFAGFVPRSLRWSPDSRYLLFVARPYDDAGEKQSYLYRWSVEDGSLLRLMEWDGGSPDGIEVSPDGHHVTMVTGETRREIWRMSFNRGG